MKKEAIIIVIFFITGIMAIPCTEIAFAADTTINMGSITIHGTENLNVVCSPVNNLHILVGPNGNTITIRVAYSMYCSGLLDGASCDISFVGGGGSDSANTDSSKSGYLTISKFMHAGDTFQVKLHALYTDYGGITTLGEDTQYANGIVNTPPPPVAGFSYSPSTPNTDSTIQFIDKSTATESTITSWSWSFGDGSSSTEKNPTYQYHSYGTFSVTLQVTDDYGQQNSMTTSISVKQRPKSVFSYSPLAPTTDDTIYFKDNSYDLDGNITSWYWNFGDSSTSNSKNPTHQYQNYGKYRVSLKVTDNDGLTDTSQANITVKKKPTSHFSFSPTAPRLDDTIQFTDLSTAYNATITSWSWNFGDGSTSTEKNPTHKYQTEGTYSITLEVTDSNGLKRAKTISISNENKVPTSDFSYSPLEPKLDDTIQFIDSSYDSDGTIKSWSWNFGDGTSSTEKNPTHKYTNSGTYTVTLQVTDNYDDTNIKTSTITIPKNTPGFELILIISAIALILFLKRKSKKQN